MLRQSMLILPVVLCGCTGGVIQSVDLAPGQNPPSLGQPVEIVIRGSGTCIVLNVNWGDDGAMLHSYENLDLTAGAHINHVYSGWPGGRTITVTAQYQCIGSARTYFITAPAVASLAWDRDPNGDHPAPSTCVEFPGMPDIPRNSIVRITAKASPQINFGCPFNGCIY